jgi:UDP-N-acetylmuramoyl-tripeptide--D-alanyl-D-alanine ligase
MTISEIHALFLKSHGACTDTRNITKNCLFIALKGANFDGNKFAYKAIESGARYALVDDTAHITSNQIILVSNTLETLQQLANYHRRFLNIPIVALTGSNGKTTTKELIAKVLSKKYNTVATIGNLNNHIGVPLTLLSMNKNTDIGIVEMGANHLKEIELLASIAEPDYGYITNFGKAHLEGFGGLEGVIKGKSELYAFLEKTNGKAFVNPNDSIQHG